jgi:hypothetical protein
MTIAKHTITVFNKYYGGDFQPPFPPSEAWNRTVIKFGQWEDTTDRNFTNNGITSIDKHIEVIIPKTANTMGKGFVKVVDWYKLTTDKKLTKWTVQAGDYVFFGEAPEITTLYTMKQAMDDFKYCMIKTVEDLSDQPVLPHWEITGI